jgi:hypothetical protein
MDNTSWPEAAIASSAIISVTLFLCVIAWQISAIVRTGMTRDDAKTANNDSIKRA